MTYGFLDTSLTVVSANGRDDELLSPLHFRTRSGLLYRVPVGSFTDGMSTPAIIHPLPGFEPFGKHWLSAVLHDSPYRGTLEIFRFTTYYAAKLSRLQADQLLREALESQGVGVVRRNLIYAAVRAFGWRSYKRTRS